MNKSFTLIIYVYNTMPKLIYFIEYLKNVRTERLFVSKMITVDPLNSMAYIKFNSIQLKIKFHNQFRIVILSFAQFDKYQFGKLVANGA